MKRLVALMMCAVSLGAAAQSTITYPYNPDGNADAHIGVTDLQDMLSVYGGAFSPSEIQIDGVGLGEVLTQLLTTQTELQQTIAEQQAYIAQLQQHISVNDATVLISGANLQVVSGEGSTDAPVNGTGNIIIGYDEEYLGGEDKSGSHNLVVGYGHTYSAFGGIVVGYVNGITASFSSVSGGDSNIASGFFSSVSGGTNNAASGQSSSVSGGGYNTAFGNGSSVLGNLANTWLNSESLPID